MSDLPPPSDPEPGTPGGSLPPVGSTLPPPPPMPGGPEPLQGSGRIRGRTWLLAGAVGLGVLIAILIVAALSSGNHDALPDQVGQLERLHTAQAGALEDQMGSLKIGDLKIEVASYGSADEVELVLFRYSNLPTTLQVDAMLRGAAGGIIGVGGTADSDAETVHTLDGIDYRCIPFTGRLFPDDPADTSGQVCAWEEGSDVAVLIDARTAVAEEAASDAQAAHVALA